MMAKEKWYARTLKVGGGKYRACNEGAVLLVDARRVAEGGGYIAGMVDRSSSKVVTT